MFASLFRSHLIDTMLLFYGHVPHPNNSLNALSIQSITSNSFSFKSIFLPIYNTYHLINLVHIKNQSNHSSFWPVTYILQPFQSLHIIQSRSTSTLPTTHRQSEINLVTNGEKNNDGTSSIFFNFTLYFSIYFNETIWKFTLYAIYYIADIAHISLSRK